MDTGPSASRGRPPAMDSRSRLPPKIVWNSRHLAPRTSLGGVNVATTELYGHRILRFGTITLGTNIKSVNSSETSPTLSRQFKRKGVRIFISHPYNKTRKISL